jgi:pimeloyl-ACP methyl ester carboxylesterase
MSQGAREVPREVGLTALERRVVSEGNDLGYHVLGEGRSPVLLANGLGGSWRAWSHQLKHFLSGERTEGYQFVSWDYRGLYASKRPKALSDLDPKSQARDALAILDREGIEKTAVFGWSMGVQVALELVRLAPDRVSRIVLINGVAGRPWDTLANTPALGKLAPGLLRAAGKIPGLISAGTVAGVGWSRTPAMMQRLGLIGRTMDLDLFHTLASGFGDMDMEVYVETLRQLGEHDAHDVLRTIRVPVLLIAGARDLMTPRAAFERIAAEVPNSELLVVPGGTHYVAVEYPEVVNLRIERFFRQHPEKRVQREIAG